MEGSKVSFVLHPLLVAGLLSLGVAIGCGYDVPSGFDTTVAVGPSAIVTENNGLVWVHQASGDVSSNGGPLTCTGAAVADPDAQYDSATDRWFFTSFDGDGGIALAVTVGATPLAPYACYRLASALFNGITDQPRLSVTANKVSITPQAGDSSVTLVINKADAVAGVSLHTARVTHSLVFRPARNVTGEGQLYLVGHASNRLLRIKVVTGVPGTSDPVMVASADTNVTFDLTSGTIPDATDPSGVQYHDSLISRTMHAVEVYGILYTLTQTVEDGIGKLGIAQVYDLIAPFAPKTLQLFTVAPPDQAAGGIGIVCPAIAATPDHDLVIGFSAASPIHYLSIYATGRHVGDGFDTLRPPRAVKFGAPWVFPPAGGPFGSTIATPSLRQTSERWCSG